MCEFTTIKVYSMSDHASDRGMTRTDLNVVEGWLIAQQRVFGVLYNQVLRVGGAVPGVQ